MHEFLYKANIKKKAIKGHGKGKRKPQEIEHIGVGFCYRKELDKSRELYKQINGREIHIKFKSCPTPIYIINVNAPQQGRPPNERIKFYESLDDTIWHIPSHYQLFVVGDFNARIHGRYPHEEWSVGPHIFGRGLQFLDKRKEEHKIYNRDLLLQTAIGNNLVVANTWKEKPPNRQITHLMASVVCPVMPR